MPREIFTGSEMVSAIDRHLKNKIDSLNGALKDMKLETLDEKDAANPLVFASRLTQLAPELMQKELQAHEQDARMEQ